MDHLQRLYAGTDDPWSFRESAYEQARFRATAAALPRPRYAAALEIGCGNGELARHLAPRCERYHGVDAVEAALAAARCRVPGATFSRLFLPAPLPAGPFDLILLSEILYFLDAAGLQALGREVRRRPAADVVCVTWRGPTGHPLQGEEALARFVAASGRTFARRDSPRGCRIDVARGHP
ncbi:methyltransferase [Roseivivax isoporae LMG 25204]|uniref:Methyltransferase n=2 Tax=Roseivivax TaxID=93682 RepID=X7F3Q3_9RHOB|nr:methyltransferase [Roseivivax isoporae LMG 25204]